MPRLLLACNPVDLASCGHANVHTLRHPSALVQVTLALSVDADDARVRDLSAPVACVRMELTSFLSLQRFNIFKHI